MMQLPKKTSILMAALSGVLAGVAFHQTGEISASEYRVLRNEFRQGTAESRDAIAAAMHSGEINRWEYRNLLDRYRNETDRFSVGSDALNLREERLVLAAMARQINRP